MGPPAALRSVAIATLLSIAGARRCRAPPDGSAFPAVTKDVSCGGLGRGELYACEEAVQRLHLGASALAASDGCDAVAPGSSIVRVGSRDTVPNAQTWSEVEWASYEGSRFLLHDPTRSLFRAARGDGASVEAGETLVLGASKWGLFYHDGEDATVGAITSAPFDVESCDVAFAERVYVLNILTWQVGHLLIDILEPLYYAMARDGGGTIDSENSRIVLEVATEAAALEGASM